ncbi:hypothetical protein SADUNF_Sadunf10G0193100 [Salix dunnii]|uniref:ribonuclease Z n=1 Tax=Salix dunnii TaxID=1413687 RepID=A0A835JUP0_9ROSI|nr:hypothetical protein SADUNF_Sadunf10G0193100 [Salix dunnii]
MHFVDCRDTIVASWNSFIGDTEDINNRTTNNSVEAGLGKPISSSVVYCPEAFGVVLKAAERNKSAEKVIPEWKLVYSGDKRPCLELIEVARGATILIHEAGFMGISIADLPVLPNVLPNLILLFKKEMTTDIR